MKVSGRLISIGDAIESQRAAENGHLRLPETGGMTVLMKNSQKVLPFPQPPKVPGAQTIICQIGEERFAIHYEIEDLPPAAPVVPWKLGFKKAIPKLLK
jgi:hypothetical protein